MKHLLTLLFIIAFIAQGTSQDKKSRFLTQDVVVCPIEYAKLFSENTFFDSPSGSLIRKTDSIIKIVDAENAKIDNKSVSGVLKIKELKVDTFYRFPILMRSGLAFEVLGEFGSFSMIKFWNVPNKSTKYTPLIPTLWLNETFPKTLQRPKNLIENINIGYNKDTIFNLDYTKVFGNIINKDSIFNIDYTKEYYLIKTSLLNKASKEFENLRNKNEIGILTIPVKIRPFATQKGQFEFASGLNIGVCVTKVLIHKWTKNKTVRVVGNISISNFTLDSAKLGQKQENYNTSAFSPSFGFIWEKNNAQICLLTGIDFLPGNLNRTWVYHNRPWIGIGLGVGLFKINSTGQDESGKN